MRAERLIHLLYISPYLITSTIRSNEKNMRGYVGAIKYRVNISQWSEQIVLGIRHSRNRVDEIVGR